MFWIGFAVGTGVACLIVIGAIAALGWAVSKERTANAGKMEKYWRDSLEVQNRNSDTFERIESLLRYRNE